jgi:hypothetical protein
MAISGNFAFRNFVALILSRISAGCILAGAFYLAVINCYSASGCLALPVLPGLESVQDFQLPLSGFTVLILVIDLYA